MKEEKSKSKKRVLYYLILAVCVLLLAAATVLTVYFVSSPTNDVLEIPDETEEPDTSDTPKEPDDKPSSGGDVVDSNPYVAPLASASYTMEFASIYKNATVGWIYRHYAIDFAADAGTDIFAMADGTVTTVSYNENTGNYVVVDHGNGLSSVYRFVEPVAGLGVGQKVVKGEVIGTVAEAYGSEYKDGTHLHFEVLENGKAVDPTTYFEAVLEEK